MKIKPSLILTVILAFATLYFYQDPQANGNTRLALTRSIVENGSLKIDVYQEQGSFATIDKAYVNGHYYSDKAPGSSFLAIPFYFLLFKLTAFLRITLESAMIKHLLTSLVIGSCFVINGLVLFKIARLVTPNDLKAFTASLSVSLGTLLWPYSAVYYGHVPAAMFLAVAFYLLFSMSQNHIFTKYKFFWTGVAFGFAFITDFTTSLILVGLILYAIYLLFLGNRKDFIRLSLFGALGTLVPLSLLFGYNLSIFGTIFGLGYSHEILPEFQQGHAAGFMGIGMPNLSVLYHLTIDPQFGLFWQSPVLGLALAGYFLSIKKNAFRAEALVSFYSICIIILMNAGFYMWWGGSAVGPRLLIVALPFFIVPLALIPDKLIWALVSLSILSAAQMLIPLLSKIQIGLDYNPIIDQFSINKPFNEFSILYNYNLQQIYKLITKHSDPWTLGRALGLRFRYAVLLLVTVESFLVGLFVWNTKRKSS